MNPDLHMAGEPKAGGGNLFTIFGEPDIALHLDGDALRVELHGVDIVKPALGRVDSSDADGIACWFIDTDYPASCRIAVKVINHLGDEVMKVFAV